ncbi:GRAM-domain-containing protein [Lentinula edodes]|uniref:GRAM-domain-containing protein n=1 Tax=Lentinula edodes TaxID=5353 RepID=A0A1Q3EA05_LENED|nr:GRAM-domain-containing protein [Lentinula edodes]
MQSDNGANSNADNNTEYIQDPANLDYYSGLESDDSNDSDINSSDEDDLVSAIDVHDMPVTGFAVASSRRNADFHEMFRNIPEGDYLIEDYGCALQREILIQGRLYISENHICFHANILGWITDLSIPIDEIISLEKKMTAFVIPNAILITTRQSKYTFASFLSRDTTYDVIYNIWRLVRPGTLSDNASIGSGSREGGIIEGTVIGGNVDGSGNSPGAMVPGGGITQNKVTFCKCGKEGKHFSELAMDTVIPGTPDKIHNLMFTSGFLKDFLVTNQKLIDLQMSDWTPGDDNLLSRTMSYIKPLTGSVGPKQTKCEIRDEVQYCDFSPSNANAYSSTLTTTRTPDVPSGGAFSVKTRTCITYASAISSRVVVTTQVEWTGRSFIKGLIERGAIDGQKTYHLDLEKAMRAYIQEHQTEFVPEGVKLDVVVAPPTTAASSNGSDSVIDANADSASAAGGKPSSRGLQWAWETIEGTWGVAKQSTKGALEILGDMIPPPSTLSSTSILYLIIFSLVVSNIWTWMRVPKTGTVDHRSVGGKPSEMLMKVEGEERERILKEEREDRERWIHGVVTALWSELAAGKVPNLQSQQQQTRNPMSPTNPMSSTPLQSFDDALSDVFALYKTLDQAEMKVNAIRDALGTLQAQLGATKNEEESKDKENLNSLD